MVWTDNSTGTITGGIDSNSLYYAVNWEQQKGSFYSFKKLPAFIRRWFSDSKNKYEVEEFFKLVKGGAKEVDFKKAQQFRNKVIKKYKQAIKLWQHHLCKQMAEQSIWLKKEIEIVKLFWNIKYVYETDVSDLEDNGIKGRILRKKSLADYKWDIPSEHIKTLLKAKSSKLFDDIIILYTRKKKKSLELDKDKEWENSQTTRKVDPIAFWKIESTDRLYFLCDWEDDECDLTLNKLEKSIKADTLK